MWVCKLVTIIEVEEEVSGGPIVFTSYFIPRLELTEREYQIPKGESAACVATELAERRP